MLAVLARLLTFEAEATLGKAGNGAADVVGYSRLGSLGRIAQRESARFTRGRSLVRSQVRPLKNPLL